MVTNNNKNTNGRKRYFTDEQNLIDDQDTISYDDQPTLSEQHVDNFGQTRITDDEQFKDDDIEFSTEFLADEKQIDDDNTDDFMSQSFGWLAVVLAILAFFTMPVLFGVAGIVLGFISRNRGFVWLGNTAIVLSVLALIIQLIIFPFV